MVLSVRRMVENTNVSLSKRSPKFASFWLHGNIAGGIVAVNEIRKSLDRAMQSDEENPAKVARTTVIRMAIRRSKLEHGFLSTEFHPAWLGRRMFSTFSMA